MLELFVKMTGLPEPVEAATSQASVSALRALGHLVLGTMGLGIGLALGSILATLVGFFAFQLC